MTWYFNGPKTNFCFESTKCCLTAEYQYLSLSSVLLILLLVISSGQCQAFYESFHFYYRVSGGEWKSYNDLELSIGQRNGGVIGEVVFSSSSEGLMNETVELLLSDWVKIVIKNPSAQFMARLKCLPEGQSVFELLSAAAQKERSTDVKYLNDSIRHGIETGDVLRSFGVRQVGEKM